MRVAVLIILIICFAGCNKKHGVPEGILNTDKMQSVLWDVVLAEAYTAEFIKKDSLKNADIENAKLQQQIFSIHKISKKEFYDSYSYYNGHVELMKILLDSITTRAEKEREIILYGKPRTLDREPFSLLPPPISVPEKLTVIPMPIPTLIPEQNSNSERNTRPVFNNRPKQRAMPPKLHDVE
jgi:hypothetical protein